MKNYKQYKQCFISSLDDNTMKIEYDPGYSSTLWLLKKWASSHPVYIAVTR